MQQVGFENALISMQDPVREEHHAPALETHWNSVTDMIGGKYRYGQPGCAVRNVESPR
jgi:hypothetical protein